MSKTNNQTNIDPTQFVDDDFIQDVSEEQVNDKPEKTFVPLLSNPRNYPIELREAFAAEIGVELNQLQTLKLQLPNGSWHNPDYLAKTMYGIDARMHNQINALHPGIVINKKNGSKKRGYCWTADAVKTPITGMKRQDDGKWRITLNTGEIREFPPSDVLDAILGAIKTAVRFWSSQEDVQMVEYTIVK